MVNIRKLKKEDILQVVKLEELYLGETLGKEMLESEIDSNVTNLLVLEYNDLVIGYIGFYYYLGEVEVLNFVIDEAYQRCGYGQMLFNKIFEIYPNTYKIILEVRRSNQKGINFYLKNGFVQVGVRKEYYKNKEDALLLVKEVKRG